MENAKVSNQQLLTKKYIEEYELEKIISEMLNSLVHEKSKQPIVYMIKYLAGLLTETERQNNHLVIPEPYPKGKPIVKFPDIDKEENKSLVKKHLNKNIWNSLKYNKTKHGGNIMNMTKLGENSENDKVGIILTDGDCMSAFSPLLEPLIADLHNYNEKREFQQRSMHHGSTNALPQTVIERISDKVNYFRVSYSRNLCDMPYSSIITNEKRCTVENALSKEVENLMTENVIRQVSYIKLKGNEEKANEILKYISFDQNWMKLAELTNSNFKLVTFRLA